MISRDVSLVGVYSVILLLCTNVRICTTSACTRVHPSMFHCENERVKDVVDLIRTVTCTTFLINTRRSSVDSKRRREEVALNNVLQYSTYCMLPGVVVLHIMLFQYKYMYSTEYSYSSTSQSQPILCSDYFMESGNLDPGSACILDQHRRN
jgi:hypothetical protein